MRPAFAGKISRGTCSAVAKNRRSQCIRYSAHFWSVRKSSIEDLISTIQISPSPPSATRSARRPESSGSSGTQDNPSVTSKRCVPRETASAVCDWRRSSRARGGETVDIKAAVFDRRFPIADDAPFSNRTFHDEREPTRPLAPRCPGCHNLSTCPDGRVKASLRQTLGIRLASRHATRMKPSLTFWYDFASTYSWLAAERVEALTAPAGVEVVWRPFLLGPIFVAQGWTSSPFNLFPAKGRNMWRDLERICAELSLPPMRQPDPFPQNSLLAARVALVALTQPLGGKSWGEQFWGEEFCRAVFCAEFAEGRRI